MNCWTSPRAPRPGAGGQRGAAAAFTLLFLPVLAVLLALVVDVAHLFGVRAALQAAADMGALAGAQAVDLDALAQGRRRLQEDEAAGAAREWVRGNLLAHPLTRPLAGAAEVEVRVIQADEGEPARHPWSGRELEDPTVAVRIRVQPRFHGFAGLWPPPLLEVRADASVKFRR